MKFLDEQIIVNISGFTAPTTGTYPYTITNKYSETIFVGNVFLQANAVFVNINITDIAANQKWLPTVIYDGNSNQTCDMIDKFTVTLAVNGTNYTDTSDTVLMIYRYPNRKSILEQTPLDEWNVDHTPQLMLQGVPATSGSFPVLTPRYPWMNGEDFQLISVYNVKESSIPPAYQLELKGDYTYSISYAAIGYTELLYFSLNYFYNQAQPAHVEMELAENDTWDMENDGDIHSYYSDRGWSGNVNYACIEYNDHSGDEPEWVNAVNMEFPTGSHVELVWEVPITEDNYIDIADGVRLGYGYVQQGGEIHANQLYVEFVYENITRDLIGGTLRVSANFKQTNVYDFEITDIAVNVYLQQTGDIYLTYNNNPMIIFDKDCISHYYLQWQDRYGSFQCQPFSKVETYSEDFTRNEVTNYLNEKRPCNISVMPKWKIQTDWVDEKYYPFYESIFVSPFLRLYDTEEDKSYMVNVTGNYTEKTFENQHSFFNLSLDLTLNKNQNIIY